MRLLFVAAAAAIASSSSLAAQQLPRAIYTDPPRDTAHPARMEVLHVPSGGVKINGVAYLASGAGAHPTFVFFHGLPGNEKNLDLAQAVRRAGWHAITVNYRGSWGSPGQFRFGNTLEDADAVLAFLRDSANARRLGVDTSRLVIAGHSMGGWVVAHTAAHDRGLLGGILISAADMGSRLAGKSRSESVAFMADNMEALAGVTAESMVDDLLGGAAKWRFEDAAPGLARVPLLVMTSGDGLAPRADSLVKALRAKGNASITTVHQPTDHSWSDKRIALESAVLRWLQRLPRRTSTATRPAGSAFR
jgi:pimeloyl-ACP methyl ester carboxylesterase